MNNLSNDVTNKPKVVIMCGGKGTRMQEITSIIPKPLVEIGGKPILWHIMKTYSHFGFNDFILCLGYKGDLIKDYFLNYSEKHTDFTYNLKTKKKIHHESLPENWNITFANTGEENQTGSRLKQIEKYIEGDFFLTYGDGVADVNITQLLKFHRAHGKIGTVTTVRPFTRFGNLTLDENHQVLDFAKLLKTHEGWIDGGFFVFNKSFFKYLSNAQSCMIESEPLHKLARDKQFCAFKHEGFWQCCDTTKELNLLRALWDTKPRWKVWGEENV